MRAKRPYIVLSFRATVDAMAWEKRCLAEHIPGRLIPLPRELSAGCGLAWRMLRRTGSAGGSALTLPPTMPLRRWTMI